MNLKSYLSSENRGVSPVIGVILMVAITVILAAVIATFVMNMGPPKDQAPTASWSVSSSNVGSTGSDSITFTHKGGEEVDGDELYVKVSGASATGGTPNGEYNWKSDLSGPDPVSASDSVTFDKNSFSSGSGLDLSSATVKLIWKSSNTDKSDVLKTWPSN